MSFQLVAYPVLKDKVNSSIEALLVYHRIPAPSDAEKGKNLDSRIQQLTDPERRVQAQLLLKVIEILDAQLAASTSETNSTKVLTNANYVLNGLVYYVTERIFESYVLRSANNSTFRNSLNTALDITEKNKPVREDLSLMYAALDRFLREQVYKKDAKGVPAPDHGYLETQVLGEQAIPNFKVENYLLDLTKRLDKFKADSIVEAKKQKESGVTSKASSSSALAANTLFTPLPTKKREEDTPTTEADAQAPDLSLSTTSNTN